MNACGRRPIAIYNQTTTLENTQTAFAPNTWTSLKQRVKKYYAFCQWEHHPPLPMQKPALYQYIQYFSNSSLLTVASSTQYLSALISFSHRLGFEYTLIFDHQTAFLLKGWKQTLSDTRTKNQVITFPPILLKEWVQDALEHPKDHQTSRASQLPRQHSFFQACLIQQYASTLKTWCFLLAIWDLENEDTIEIRSTALASD